MSEHVSRVQKLYKLILRLHRGLPEDLRLLGDIYAKDEFKRHKNCKPEEARIFLNEWREYAGRMSRQAAPRGARAAQGGAGARAAGAPWGPRYGDDIPVERFLYMNPEQLLTLYHMHVNFCRESTIDAGINLISADVMNKKLQEAKNYLLQMEKDHQVLIERGLLDTNDMTTIRPAWWIELFDCIMAAQDEEALKFLQDPNKKI